MRPNPFAETGWISANTVMSGLVWGIRGLGLSEAFLNFNFGQAHAPARKARLFANHEGLPTDVFVATYPKSGTNWMMQLAVQLSWDGQAEFPHIHSIVPWPEGLFPGLARLEDDGWRQAPHPHRVIKTAIELDLLPVDSPARFLSVIRDPKAVVASSYAFITGIFGMGEHISPSQWVDWTLAPNNPLLPWADHTAQLWAQRERENVLLLQYDDLKRDRAAGVDRVAAFLGIELDAAARERVIERTGFAWMSSHESRFAPPQLRFRKGGPTRMLHHGGKGNPADLFTLEELRRIDAHALARFEALGSDYPFAELHPVTR